MLFAFYITYINSFYTFFYSCTFMASCYFYYWCKYTRKHRVLSALTAVEKVLLGCKSLGCFFLLRIISAHVVAQTSHLSRPSNHRSTLTNPNVRVRFHWTVESSDPNPPRNTFLEEEQNKLMEVFQHKSFTRLKVKTLNITHCNMYSRENR